MGIDARQLCMGCMGEKGESIVCPACGYEEGTPAGAPQYLPPRTLLNGRYLLGRVLGQGGFGITYLAWDVSLETKLAIKEYMPRDFSTRSADQTMVTVYSGDARSQFDYGLEKFLEEAKILIKFNSHPGIVSVRDFFKENDTAYLVMYYLDGITFKDFLQQQGGRTSFDNTLKIMNPIMDVLRELHQHELLHRDISPDNIYITRERQVKLLDFGAARQAMGDKNHSLSVVLKPGYAPEEQYRTKGKQGPWTDIYAVAATMYRAMTGEVPPESLDRIEEDTIVPPSRLGVAIPPRAEDALMQALAVRASDRFQSMSAFQAALSGAAAPAPEPWHGGQPQAPMQSAAMQPTMEAPLQAAAAHQASMQPTVQAPHQAPMHTSAYPPGRQPAHGQAGYGGGQQPPRRGTAPWIWWTGGGALAAIIVAAGLIFFLNRGPAMMTVPDLSGKSWGDAVVELSKASLTYTMQEQNSETVPLGNVISQDPKAGAKLAKEGKVTVYKSLGPKAAPVPTATPAPTATPKPSAQPTAKPAPKPAGAFAKVMDGSIDMTNLQFVDAADLEGLGRKDLVTAQIKPGKSVISFWGWAGNHFEKVGESVIPEEIHDMSATNPVNGVQGLVMSAQNTIYTIDYVNGDYEQTKVDVPYKPIAVRMGQLDKDGQLDLVILGENPDKSWFIAYKPSTQKEFQTLKIAENTTMMNLADMNQDGLDDLFFLDGKDAKIYEYMWNGTTFEKGGDGDFGGGIVTFYPYDLTSDGMAELVISQASGTDSYSMNVYGVVNNDFELLEEVPLGQRAYPQVGDFDGDGNVDMLAMRIIDDKKLDYGIYTTAP